MKKLILLFVLIFISCSKDKIAVVEQEKITTNDNKVLILKVDYNTNTFLEGKELILANNTATFSANIVITSNASDGGKIEVFYQELNEKLFEGQQNWFGLITFPTNFLSANNFPVSLTNEVVSIPVVENIYNPNNEVYDYIPVLNSVLYLQIVKNYRMSYPNQSVKLFKFSEYGLTPASNSQKWIIIFKN